jgi:predicted O-methyltransferase YrrM
MPRQESQEDISAEASVWPVPPPDAPREELEHIDKIIEEAFEQIDDPSASQLINAYLLDLYGSDPFTEVYDACEPHREAHGPECGVYPAAPQKMHTLATIVKAIGARSGLEIGGGLGYSALWLADALAPEGRLESIDRHEVHVSLIEEAAGRYGLTDCLRGVYGEADDILQRLSGPYDFIHDDGWFGEQPAYYNRMVELLRPGGLLILANCFLLEDAITGRPRNDWAQFAGPRWAENVQAYARKLVSDPRLHTSFIMRPAWVGLAYKRPDA